jgi:hypothetical protein
MSIINWKVWNKVQKKKRLTYSKEILTKEDFTLWGKTKKFFKKLFFKK